MNMIGLTPAFIAAAVVIVGLVTLLKKIGVSREQMIITALIAGLLLGACIGTCFGQFEQKGERYDRSEKNYATNYIDGQDPRIQAQEPGYHASNPYNTAPQTTVVYGWSAITGALSSAWGAIARYAWPEQFN
jgi:hypothetical protein